MVKRVLVGYGIDVDAVAIHINTKTGAPASLSNVSRGNIPELSLQFRLQSDGI